MVTSCELTDTYGFVEKNKSNRRAGRRKALGAERKRYVLYVSIVCLCPRCAVSMFAVILPA